MKIHKNLGSEERKMVCKNIPELATQQMKIKFSSIILAQRMVSPQVQVI